MDKELEEIINNLESKIAFLEYNQDKLSEEVSLLRDINYKQQIQLKYLAEKLKAAEFSNVASKSEETPPPHY